MITCHHGQETDIYESLNAFAMLEPYNHQNLGKRRISTRQDLEEIKSPFYADLEKRRASSQYFKRDDSMIQCPIFFDMQTNPID